MTVTQAPPNQAGGGTAGNPYNTYLYTVVTPSGADLNLQTQEEADQYERLRDRYQTDNSFPNISDLMDLDRLLLFEVMAARWSYWISQGFDYLQARVDEGTLKDNIKAYSVEIRLLKASLGIDKSTRDKEKGESLSDYTGKLLERAKIFGYHRNEQYEIAVTRLWELVSMVKTFDRCDDEERAQLDLSPETVMDYVRKQVIPGWDAHVDAFRAQQSMWIREM